jgi:CBS domain containing-hemolysin-like protein
MSGVVWTVLAILIVANSLYVAAEFGAVGVRRSRVRRLSDDGHWLARMLLPYVEHPTALDRYVGASQIGITISSLTLGAFAQATVSLPLAPLFEGWFGLTRVSAVSASTISVLVALTSVQLVIGELVPKALALQYPTETALATVLPMRGSLVIFRPVIWLLNGFATLVLRLVGIGEQTHGHLHSPEEIDLLIAESRDGGLLEAEEQQRLRRALRLGRRTARDLMVPLSRLTMLDVAASWDEVMAVVSASPYSRIPIHRGAPDHIVGMLRVKDLVERFVSEGPRPLDRLMRPVVTIAADVPADRVVTQLRERRAHSAVVSDPGGQAIGIITIQDLLSELLGLGGSEGPVAP